MPSQVGSRTESLKIGDSNILEAKCSVGRHTNLSNGCIVGAGCSLTVLINKAIKQDSWKQFCDDNGGVLGGRNFGWKLCGLWRRLRQKEGSWSTSTSDASNWLPFQGLAPFYMLTHNIDAMFPQVAYLRSTRCYPTIITWRSQQRSQLYRPRPDTRKVFRRTDIHQEQTHNRREWTDRLE